MFMGKLIELSQPRQGNITDGNLAIKPSYTESDFGPHGNQEAIVVDFTGKREERRRVLHEEARLSLTIESPTKEYIKFFNQFYNEEGLPKDWQKLQYGENQVGFSIRGQMELLKGDDSESRKIWAKQSRQDLQGFVIEYLSPYIVYPWNHEKKLNPDGSASLVDARYGNKKMVDTVSEEERNGTVKRVVEAMDRAVIEKKIPNKSIFVQWSPMDESPTGLKQDNGDDVVYSDTHLIVSQVDGDRLNGFTVKTDLSQLECREMIRRLTGRVVPAGAPVEEYINAVALIDPAKGRIASVEDVIVEAANVREELSLGSVNAYKDKTWSSVIEQIYKGDRLYEFTDNMQAVLRRFEEDVLRDNPTKEELPFYIAAAVLRVSQEAQVAKQQAKQKGAGGGLVAGIKAPTFGRTLDETARIPGCAGGGKTAVSSAFGISRAVDKSSGVGGSSSCAEIACGNCTWKADSTEVDKIQKGTIKSCPKCGWKP
jgi:hypothetical protein